MELIKAIKERKSIRAFKPDQVPLDALKKILEQAQRAPSWANTQPWEFAVATGKKLKAIQDAFIKRGAAAMMNSKPDVPRPPAFPEPFASRIKKMQLQENRGRTSQATKEEMEARTFNNWRHYGATTCIYLLVDKKFLFQEQGTNMWALFDNGAVEQTIMLLALEYGLGTIAQAMAVTFPDIIHKELGIPDDKLVALGIAIGYPDWNNKANEDYRMREPFDEICKFYGFEK